MKRVIFIDHVYHSKTRSSNSFRDDLAQVFEVKTIFVDPDDFDMDDLMTQVEDAIGPDTSIYVWQLDFLLPLFMTMNLPVICSPMFDGSGILPPEHWKLLSDVRFVNFSLRLHQNARNAGAASLYAKYFPKPGKRINFGKGLRGFFWRRRPEHGIDIALIDRVFGSQLASLHIHDAPDTPEGAAIPLETDRLRYPVTTSVWFDNPGDMLKVMRKCNFYIAPRVSEGIGMGFLEAMGAGMLVAANDAPTHDEYISNGLNGLLFNFNSQDMGTLRDPEKIARSAYQGARLGRGHWLRSKNRIHEFVDAAQPVSSSLTLEQARALVRAYQTDLDDYRKALVAALANTSKKTASPKPPRVLLGTGFHLVETASARFFPVRVVWTSEPTFSLVPLQDTEDLTMIFRSGRGGFVEGEIAHLFKAYHGDREIPLEAVTFEDSAFFKLVVKAGTYSAYENLRIDADWPMFEVGSGKPGQRRKQGLLLFEDGVELVQL